MKLLVVLCAAVACAVAKPGFAYSSIAASPYGIVGPHGIYGAPGLVGPAISRTIVGPAIAPAAVAAPVLAAAPAVVGAHTYAAAPAVVGAHTYAAAPIVSAAPAIAAPVVAPAPAVVAARTIAAAPVVAAAPAVVAHAPAVAAAPAVTKYHAQNEHGEASYGHTEPLQTHTAVQDAHGNKVGSFSYLNPHDGQVHRTDYVADALGYRVASNDLPVHVAPVAHAIHRRSVVVSHTPLLTQTPGSTALLAHAAVAPAVAAPLAYSGIAAPVAAPLAYSGIAAPVAAPLAYSGIAAPHAYAAGIAAPLAYSAGIAAPLAVAPAVHGVPATLTTIANNPGHAVSYRVD